MILDALKAIVLALLAVVLGGVVFYFAPKVFPTDWFLRDTGRPLDPYRGRLLGRAAADLVAQIPTHDDIQTVYVTARAGRSDRANDPIRDAVVDAFAGRPSYRAYEAWTYLDYSPDVRTQIDHVYGRTSREEDLLAQLQATLNQMEGAEDVDAVIRLEALDFRMPRAGGRHAKVDIQARLFSLEQDGYVGEPVRATQEMSGGWLWFSTYMHSFSVIYRMVIWVLLVGSLPFVTVPLVRAVTRKRRNDWNMYLVTAYAGWSVLLALILIGFWISSIWSVLGLFLALIVGGLYNLAALDWLDEQFHG